MSRRPKNLTTTSYAILGLLAAQPWTTYELTQQVRTSLRHFWPRTERQLYEQPKVLVEHGLATVTQEHVGRRARSIYRITPPGRRALKRWLATPASNWSLEWEALVRVFFANSGTKQDLLKLLRMIRDENRADDDAHRLLFAQRIDEQPFADRMHINAIVSRFFFELSAGVDRWAEWAHQEVESWPSLDQPPAHTADLLREVHATGLGDDLERESTTAHHPPA